MMSFAQDLFDARSTADVLEDRMVDALLEACGINPREPKSWPLGDVTFDDYDGSFEFKAVEEGWVPTPEQVRACLALGFSRFWVNYKNSAERYFTASPDCPVDGWFKAAGSNFGYNGDKLKRARVEKGAVQ